MCRLPRLRPQPDRRRPDTCPVGGAERHLQGEGLFSLFRHGLSGETFEIISKLEILLIVGFEFGSVYWS